MKTTYLLAGAMLLLLSGIVMAADSVEVNAAQSTKLQKIGTVQVSGIEGSLDDVTNALKAKATAMHGSHFRVVAVNIPSHAYYWSGTAIVYK